MTIGAFQLLSFNADLKMFIKSDTFHISGIHLLLFLILGGYKENNVNFNSKLPNISKSNMDEMHNLFFTFSLVTPAVIWQNIISFVLEAEIF